MLYGYRTQHSTRNQEVPHPYIHSQDASGFICLDNRTYLRTRSSLLAVSAAAERESLEAFGDGGAAPLAVADNGVGGASEVEPGGGRGEVREAIGVKRRRGARQGRRRLLMISSTRRSFSASGVEAGRRRRAAKSSVSRTVI